MVLNRVAVTDGAHFQLEERHDPEVRERWSCSFQSEVFQDRHGAHTAPRICSHADLQRHPLRPHLRHSGIPWRGTTGMCSPTPTHQLVHGNATIHCHRDASRVFGDVPHVGACRRRAAELRRSVLCTRGACEVGGTNVQASAWLSERSKN